jgi:predicted GIY-YIG superfamily endonuclease
MIYKIYRIENLLENKSYIGYTTNLKKRMYVHKYRKHPSLNGGNSIVHLLCETDCQEEASSLERKYIQEFDTMNIEKGYNLQSGGVFDYSWSESSLLKMSKSQEGNLNGLGKHVNLGIKKSDEAKKNMSLALKKRWANTPNKLDKIMKMVEKRSKKFAETGNPRKGIPRTEEDKLSMSIALKKRWKEKGHPSKGKPVSEEQKKQISETLKMKYALGILPPKVRTKETIQRMIETKRLKKLLKEQSLINPP